MKLQRILFGLMALVSATSGQMTVLAQGGGSGLQLSPTKSELTIAPGESEVIEIQLTNVTSGAVTASPEVYDFIPNDDGSPQILSSDKNDNNAVSIKSFLKDLDNTPLAAGEKKTINIIASVPKNQAAGSYYGVILFNALTGNQTEAQDGGGQVALSAGVGHIVLIQVPGAITDKLQLVRVVAGRKVDNNVTTGSIFSDVPNQVQITVKNTGTSIIQPFGNIQVEKGGKQVANIQINNADVKGNVLPNSNRTFVEELKDLKGFGRYTITVNTSYRRLGTEQSGGDILTQKLTVWVIPAWLGISAGVGLVALAAAVFFIIRKFRR